MMTTFKNIQARPLTGPLYATWEEAEETVKKTLKTFEEKFGISMTYEIVEHFIFMRDKEGNKIRFFITSKSNACGYEITTSIANYQCNGDASKSTEKTLQSGLSMFKRMVQQQ